MDLSGVVKQRGAAFWLLVIGAGLATCCGLPTVALVVLGALAPSGGSEGPPAASASASGPDDFVYRAANGLVYVATNHVSAEGVNVPLPGEWRDDHRNIVLRLREDGRYELGEGGGVLAGDSIGNATAYGSSSTERGAWRVEGSTLTLTPERNDLAGSVGTHQVESGSRPADGPRQWDVVGVTIEYTRHGDDTVRQRPGLHVRGPAPSWYYPSGAMDWTLRSAPWSGE